MPKKNLTDKKRSYKNSSGMKAPQLIIDQDQKNDLDLISKQALSSIENNYKQIIEMQDRILSAPAMNGGFTTLMYKVESIEHSQGQLVEKVDQIHDVLYEPDTGLYARIKNVENSSISPETLNNIEKDIQEIKLWKSNEEKVSEKDHANESLQVKTIQDHEMILKDLQKSILKYNAAIKWIVVSLSGGMLSMIGKLIYDYLSGHIKIV